MTCDGGSSGWRRPGAWAARQTYEAYDTYIGGLDDAYEYEESIDAHPLVQAELTHQARDLDDLAAPGLNADAIRRVAERARRVWGIVPFAEFVQEHVLDTTTGRPQPGIRVELLDITPVAEPSSH